MAFVNALTLALVALKILLFPSMSWWLVFSPVLIAVGAVLFLAIITIFILFGLFVHWAYKEYISKG
jgi:hypothetical protein